MSARDISVNRSVSLITLEGRIVDNLRRWQFRLVEDTVFLPVLWRRRERRSLTPPLPAPGERASAVLLEAFHLLARRGPGTLPWSASFRQHPIAFLLDTTGDAINLWDPAGELLYQNRAAAELGVGRCVETPLEVFSVDGRRFERRCVRCRSGSTEYVLEVVREDRQNGAAEIDAIASAP